ncbi:hypothetical protein GIB67_011404 [Kingdonia uniflora]|uniref:Uncharacterized protein n=1 Tax=Kingdonia uniflora TaxID=39325 RepID=A0A7J7NLC3_9MAGN|nr:hypothetical protein GIB67_011404 [Kingdonia uniflora]
MNTYSSDIGFQVRIHLPIIFESFKDVPNDRIALVVKGLEKKIRDAWKRYKSHLNTTLIVRNNPGDVKASPTPEFVPREDWVKFIDYCNSEKFLAKSKRNKENRAKLIAPCTLGITITSMLITRHKLAEERGVTDEEIGRVEVYIPTHTKKDKTIQCPDLIKFGKERKGGTRGMGAGMSISLVEKVGHIVNENEELRFNNNELKFSTEKLRKDLDALTKYVGNIPVISPTNNFPSQQATSSSQREQIQDNYGASGYFLETGGTNKRKHVETLKQTEVSASDKLESFRASQEVLDLLLLLLIHVGFARIRDNIRDDTHLDSWI